MADAKSTPTVEAPSSYRVKVALCITKKDDGADLYIYEGGLIPSWTNADELKRLVDGGFVEKLDGPAENAPSAESN